MFYLLLLSLSAAAWPVKGLCPPAAIELVRSCTSNLKDGASADFLNTFGNEGDANWMVVACGNGDLLTAINCIERVMEQCKNDNSDAAHFLRGMINIENYRKAVNFFCTNVWVYTASVECIYNHHTDQDICTQEAKKNFETQASATSNMDVLMRFQCILYHTVVSCVEKVYKVCSSSAADIIKTVLVGLQPPICEGVSSSMGTERVGTSDVHTADGNNSGCKLSSINCSVIFKILLVVCFLMSLV